MGYKPNAVDVKSYAAQHRKLISYKFGVGQNRDDYFSTDRRTHLAAYHCRQLTKQLCIACLTIAKNFKDLRKQIRPGGDTAKLPKKSLQA